MYRNFDDSKIIFKDELKDIKLADWIIVNSIPEIIEFDDKYIHNIIGIETPSVVLFTKKEDFF